ncbi:uncharacterized protein BP01DRAFT_352162 [Aspergillus saccharolyticus JOP 1030-1]|uniref:RING-type domain-containing protein n=1 Tax=Aspergillus saccharolyticus JOP 1030-1 TaxID=1450539 RepID=A0A319ATS1_9EURO|nr:hypothetical protein BP01DRAFT_352162 [Aspergillus saccharolyticus JOP 1030-1]PYH49592.1 hypothetical protein BP01DRAFT_352162 [Aspergillus saccharolyticus JOP 1030-1]
MAQQRAQLDHLSDILDLHPDKERSCAGYAVSQGRRCHNPISAANRVYAVRLLDEGTRGLKKGMDLKDLLVDLASFVLCRGVHQKGRNDQTFELVQKWKHQIQSACEELCEAEDVDAGRDMMHAGRRRETIELEVSRRPRWQENGLLHLGAGATDFHNSDDRLARLSDLDERNTRRASLPSARVSEATPATHSRHLASDTRQPREFTTSARTIRASASPSSAQITSSNSSPSTSSRSRSGISALSPPMISQRATFASTFGSRASTTASTMASTSFSSASTSALITSRTSTSTTPFRISAPARTLDEPFSSRVSSSACSDETSRPRPTPRLNITNPTRIVAYPSQATAATRSAPRSSNHESDPPISARLEVASSMSPTMRSEISAVTPSVSSRASNTTAAALSSDSPEVESPTVSTRTTTPPANASSDPAPSSTRTPNQPSNPRMTTPSRAVHFDPLVLPASHNSSSSSTASTGSSSPTSSTTPADPYTLNRKPMTGDCSICYEPLLQHNHNSSQVSPSRAARDISIVYCKRQCGTNFHYSCMFSWKQSVWQTGREPTCPMCRTVWQQ